MTDEELAALGQRARTGTASALLIILTECRRARAAEPNPSNEWPNAARELMFLRERVKELESEQGVCRGAVAGVWSDGRRGTEPLPFLERAILAGFRPTHGRWTCAGPGSIPRVTATEGGGA